MMKILVFSLMICGLLIANEAQNNATQPNANTQNAIAPNTATPQATPSQTATNQAAAQSGGQSSATPQNPQEAQIPINPDVKLKDDIINFDRLEQVGANIKDPFIYVYPLTPGAEERRAKILAAEHKLSSIFEGKKAMINGVWVSKNDDIEGWKVIGIDSEKVLVEFEKKSKPLYLEKQHFVDIKNAKFKLSSIDKGLCRGDNMENLEAKIDGYCVGINDKIGGWKVVDIQKNSVKLKFMSEERTLTLK